MNSGRKILHVITDLNTGGAETMLCRIATSDGPPNVHMIFSLLPGGRLAAPLRAAGNEVVEANFRSPTGIVRGLRALSRVIKRFEPDVIQGWMYHGDFAALLGLALSGRRRQTALVWSIRCSELDFSRYSLQLRAIVKLWALFSSRPDAVIANSLSGLEAHRAFGLRGRNEYVIANGVDVVQYRPDPSARQLVRAQLGIDAKAVVLAHVARVDPMKDHDTFLRAMAMIPNVQALAIGAGTEKLPAVPNVHGLGLRTDIPSLLAASDFVVSSSAFGEGFSNAIMEGMACGLPAVATDVGAARLIVGDSGVIVPPRDARAFATAIGSLAAESQEKRDNRSRRARAHICEDYSLAKTIAQFNAVYDSIRRG
jgi:glycosyltransferase involved in cell wall biosynthesis